MLSLTAMTSKEISLETILSFSPGFTKAIFPSDWIHWRIVIGSGRLERSGIHQLYFPTSFLYPIWCSQQSALTQCFADKNLYSSVCHEKYLKMDKHYQKIAICSAIWGMLDSESYHLLMQPLYQFYNIIFQVSLMPPATHFLKWT